ncbi:30S ribosomal protein S6 [Candidatus Saccharibacteria bacterium]|nr:30S ribosomal protein S6 [Candidatus Saccharibacteria bacterium]
MRNYELMVVFHPDLEMNIDPALGKVKQILKANKANITNEEVDGKKHLAYKIKNQDFGLYYYFDLELPPEAPAKISSAFNIADEIIRYLLVTTDERKAKMAAKRAEQATKATKEATDVSEAEATTNNNEEEK